MSRYLLAQAYNNAWSDHRLLRACNTLSQAAFEDQSRTSFFPSIRYTLNHNLGVQRFYLDALWRDWRGEPPHPDYHTFFEPEEPYATCPPLWQAQRESNDSLIAYCSGLRDEVLDAVVAIDRGDHVQRDTRQRLLAHLFQHQVHHRGQVHAMLAGTPVAPPQLDEFYSAGEADLRAQDFAELGWTEQQVWP
ncbi:damage-inducible protein DinB [Pseudoduganella lutea]|uniref:Damage-inducible protein DinB n=1 Tax=Pseudoduganella lutea TaxID=321985 RepID=A0A4P6L5R4_9BURK|nr:damage-inducible protein DinB [Pseudoduganella lutea]